MGNQPYAPRAEAPQMMMLHPSMMRPFPEVPIPVMTAMEFVSRCNDQMGQQVLQFRSYDGDCDYDVLEHELHHAQEAAFVGALSLLGDYFREARQAYAPPPPKPTTDSLSVPRKPSSISQYVTSGEGI